MNRSWALVRAIRGPIILITLGLLFTFDHMDVLPFYRTWPVIIIVFGLLKLIERSIAPRVPYGPTGPYPQATVPPAAPLQGSVQQPPGGTQL